MHFNPRNDKMPDFLTSTTQNKIAYEAIPADGMGKNLPGVIFCTGYRSNMNGTKATFLRDMCQARGQAFVRFDYSGHGESGGEFTATTVSHWLDDLLYIIDNIADKNRPHILVGSSMGGWLSILAALKRPEKIHGFIGVAAAPDFTEKLVWNNLSPKQKETLDTQGVLSQPSQYGGEPYVITKDIIHDARAHIVLDKQHPFPHPVRLIHGHLDQSVPAIWAEKIKQSLLSDDCVITYVDDGDHFLSREQDLNLLAEAIIELSKDITS